MILRNLLSGAKIVRLTWDGTNYVVAAGTDGSVVESGEVDTKGYNSVMFIASVGVIAASGVFTCFVKNSDTAGSYGAGTIDKLGTSIANNADTDDNKLYVIDVYRPKRRYMKFNYQRTAGNVTLDSLIAVLYNANNDPVTQQTTVGGVEASAILNNPTPSAT